MDNRLTKIIGALRIPFGRLTILTALLLFFTSVGAMNSTSSGAFNETNIPSCERIADYDTGNFSSPTEIDNEMSPLVPGTQMILEGVADNLPHTVVFTVTSLTKEIDGVPTVVLWDVDYSSDVVKEAELAFKAQDDDGNVWNLGEYPEEYEDGVFIGAPNTWIAGLAEAEPGLLMQAESHVGTGYYLQGSVPTIDFLDCAKVFKTDENSCVPFECYEDVLIIDERSPLDAREGHQRKFYAPGVGNFQIGATGSGAGEVLQLVDIIQLSDEDLAAANQEALALEARAYDDSDVYQETPPMQEP